jgi:hypothetical protein
VNSDGEVTSLGSLRWSRYNDGTYREHANNQLADELH